MFADSPRLRPAEPLEPMADAFADGLIHAGDPAAAAAALALAGPHVTGTRFALRRGERALARGDAAEALTAMIPAWETGDDTPTLSARLALAALALGLYDVAGALTDEAPLLEHRLVRWLLDIWEGDRPQPLALDRAEVAWGLRAMMQQLLRCGRDDLVAGGHRAARSLDPEAADRLGPPPPAPPTPTPVGPPLDLRAQFCAAWRGPAADAVYTWAWSAGRQILRGERALLLTPDPAPLRPLVAHGRLLCVTSPGGRTTARPGVRAEPERLPVAPSRWQHVVAGLWLEQGLAPVAALRQITGALTHEGQLHLLCAGPRATPAPGFELALRLSPAVIEQACRRAGLGVAGISPRAADGSPTTPEEAAVVLVRAERRVI